MLQFIILVAIIVTKGDDSMIKNKNVVNISRIKGRMAEKGISGVLMAEKLGLSLTGFYKKMNKKSQFTSNEIGEIAIVLNTTPNFFYDDCYDNSNKGFYFHAEMFLKLTNDLSYKQIGLLVNLFETKFFDPNQLDNKLSELEQKSENAVIDVFNKMVSGGFIHD